MVVDNFFSLAFVLRQSFTVQSRLGRNSLESRLTFCLSLLNAGIIETSSQGQLQVLFLNVAEDLIQGLSFIQPTCTGNFYEAVMDGPLLILLFQLWCATVQLSLWTSGQVQLSLRMNKSMTAMDASWRPDSRQDSHLWDGNKLYSLDSAAALRSRNTDIQFPCYVKGGSPTRGRVSLWGLTAAQQRRGLAWLGFNYRSLIMDPAGQNCTEG